MIIWSAGKALNRVPKGRQTTLKCKACNKLTTWYESTVDEGLKLYFVVDLFKRSKRVMQCGECLGVCNYDEVFPDEKVAREAAAAEAEAKRKQAAAEDLKRKEEAANKKFAEEQKAREADVLDELEELKRKMGK